MKYVVTQSTSFRGSLQCCMLRNTWRKKHGNPLEKLKLRNSLWQNTNRTPEETQSKLIRLSDF